MTASIILASGSEIRQTLLRNACVPFEVLPVKIDESAIRDALIAEGAKPRDVADQLAEFKARKASQKSPDSLVIGCDQILEHDGVIFAKANDPQEIRTQLDKLNGTVHKLHSAAVIYENCKPVWRHVGTVKLHMRKNSPEYLTGYISRNWESIRHSVGGYKLEEEGVRLFHRIEGDYFTVLGLPMLELLAYLTLRNLIPA